MHLCVNEKRCKVFEVLMMFPSTLEFHVFLDERDKVPMVLTHRLSTSFLKFITKWLCVALKSIDLTVL